MHTSLTHIPPNKQQELQTVVQHLRLHAPAEMIILFGSYARGDWVEEYAADGIHFEYQSDLDLLVIVETRSLTEQNRLEHTLEDAVESLADIHTPVSIIVHDIDYVNCRIARAEYFFADIKREGVLLFDSGKFKLAKVRRIRARERYHLAKEDFAYWFSNAIGYSKQYRLAINENELSIGAFLLHQVAERLYTTVLLVFTRYKPKTHNLQMLRKLVNALDPRFIKVFPFGDKEDRRRFELLRRAYVDARYSKNYTITADELNWLAERVNALKYVTEELCQEKIDSFLVKPNAKNQEE